MALVDKKISGDTPVRDFPEKYNTLIDELINEINELKQVISNQNTVISNLKSDLNSALGRMRAEYTQQIDSLDDKYEKKKTDE